MTGFDGGKVYFRVLINGQLVHISNENTLRQTKKGATDEQRDGWSTFLSHNINYGNNSLEISVFSEQAETDAVSRARVEIKSLKFIGVGNLVGGATECIKAP